MHHLGHPSNLVHHSRTWIYARRIALPILIAMLGLLSQDLRAKDGPRFIHHDLMVSLDPLQHGLEVTDTISFPEGFDPGMGIDFRLHEGLSIRSLNDTYRIVALDEGMPKDHAGINHAPEADAGRSFLRRYRILPTEDGTWASFNDRIVIPLSYSGRIHHPVEASHEEYARSFSQTRGLIAEEGTFLSGATGWYPLLDRGLFTFTIAFSGLGSGRMAITQGRRTTGAEDHGEGRVTWSCPHPMDEIYLIEGTFTEYSKKTEGLTAYAFLQQPDPGLAAKYLDATLENVTMYSKLLGDYPYAKFALVENFWETGYGMPSFTLLGPTVIRFPFILQSSYPHEILHNWWGNGVFVDYATGNWCEGLTAYLADHLFKEMKGQGAAHRRDTLQRFRDYVQHTEDFPLREFRARHDAATEAIGYGKSLMLFHMLRVMLGDARFVEILRTFYREFEFKKASFEDLHRVFSRVSDRDLSWFFDQWVDRGGAPVIEIADHTYHHRTDKGGELTLALRQTQHAAPFRLLVPVALYPISGDPEIRVIEMTDREVEVRFADLQKPLFRVEVDPRFDVFRILHREETPPTVGHAYGSEKVYVILPGKAEADLADAYADLAESWRSGRPDNLTVIEEDAIDALPEDGAIWVFGKSNRWRPDPSELGYPFRFSPSDEDITLAGRDYSLEDHSFVICDRSPMNLDQVICWFHADGTECFAGLKRKLPHYGKYSYLVFQGAEPTNVGKGQWPLAESPMILELGERPPKIPTLPKHRALTEPAPLVDGDRLTRHVEFLAHDRLEGRGLGSSGIAEAAVHIACEFEDAGLAPAPGLGGRIQSWVGRAGVENNPVILSNVIGVLPGSNPALKDEILVVGAHHDHLGFGWPDCRSGNEGKIHNGADDNASGVAVLLELAHILGARMKPNRAIWFVSFTAEENGLVGSRRFIDWLSLAFPEKRIYAMVNLDSVGRLEKRKLLALGTDSAREWPFIVMGATYTTGLASKCVTGDTETGDQASFHEVGVPAIHLFAGAHLDMHRPTDDANKLDYEGMEKITLFTREIVAYLADRIEPLDVRVEPTRKLARGTATDSPSPAVKTVAMGPKTKGMDYGKSGHPGKMPGMGHPGGSTRNVSLGTMPDFEFEGKGIRIAAIIPGSPAHKAGLAKGDIVLKVGGKKVTDLTSYNDAIKAHAPGDRVKILYSRDGREIEVQAVLVKR